jgi:hypothetical protein
MSIDERKRHALYERLDEVLDAEHADALMELLPPVGWAEVATKHDLEALRIVTTQDIEALRTEMRAEFVDVRSEMQAEFVDVRSTMQAEFADVRSTMQAEFADVRSEMRVGFAEARAELHRELRHQLWIVLGGLTMAVAANQLVEHLV